tara:strand:- start:167 stop:1807 length:1641 start_codon:yes stop_codon:yes gene_type:complete
MMGDEDTPTMEVPERPGDVSASDAAKALIVRQKAREGVVEFAEFVDPMYKSYPVHRLIGDRLDRIEKGELRRLAIFVPPAIGKSRLVSEIFPAYFLGRNPALEVIQTSYDDDLTKGFGRMVRNTVAEKAYQLLFPGVEIAKDAKAMDAWKTVQGGEYKAEPWGGGLIGFHANVLIMDDPFKGYAEASNPNEQKKFWSWYTGTALNRMRSYKDGMGAVVLIMQRWHDNDFGGIVERLTEDGEEKWDIVRLPSIAEEGDMLGREPGDVLLPEGPNRRPIEELRQIQARSPRMFQSVHQQKPIADEGDLFKQGELRPYVPADLPKGLSIFMSSDFALSEGSGDFTVLIVFGVDAQGHIWLLDLWRKQVGLMGSIERCIELIRHWRPQKILCEKVGIQKVIGPAMRKKMKEEGVFCRLDEVSIIGLGGKSSEQRAGAIAGVVQMGYVHIPSDAPWYGDLEYELTRFPGGTRDDQVDSLALIGIRINSLRGSGFREEPVGLSEVQPAYFTFEDLVARNKRARLGMKNAKKAIVVKPEVSPWDILLEEELAI